MTVKNTASNSTVQNFIAAVYPKSTELHTTIGTEETILREATKQIESMRSALEFALFTIEHRKGLKHRKDLFTDDERDKLRKALSHTDES